ncbi:MAG: DEAD/DEAH box helicase, partial [Clostridia bacterium]|nr:DEAD/DEAH box helicase [Clostridia bacterium]
MSHFPNFFKRPYQRLIGRKHYLTKKFPKFTPQSLNPTNDVSLNDNTANKVNYDLSEIEKTTDRDWYDQEESGVTDDFHYIHNIMGFSSKEIEKAKEEGFTDLKQKKLQLSKPLNKKKANLIDTNKWELNRMITSGVVEKSNYNYQLYDDEDDEENKLLIQINDIKPKFLSGHVILSKQNQKIEIVKDPLSDISRMAKRGSNILRYIREKKEATKYQDNQSEQNGDLASVNDQNNGANTKNIFTDLNMNANLGIEGLSPELSQAIAESSYASMLKNKLQAVSEFAKTKTIKEQRESLPIYSVREELLNIIRDNKVVIIVGETGSGKTTQLTQYLYESGYAKYGIIGCTQPRRVAAVCVAKRVSEEMNTQLGDIVGYTIRFEEFIDENKTKIKYMTEGILLRESLTDNELNMYSVIIMDEAHERSLCTDVLFGILKKIIAKRRDLKLIITSATMNSKKFSTFFGEAPIYVIPGRTFQVSYQYGKSTPEDYVDAAVKKTIEVHLQYPQGDILVFMTGQEDIEATCLLLKERLRQLGENVPKIVILPIYSQLPSDYQARIFQKTEHRKCIVATNIAETSLTLDGVKYVIDTGLCKLKVYNPKIGMDALRVTPISQANANQRGGRAGRTGPGLCFRLYTEHSYNSEMWENNVPEIQRTNLANVVLLLKSLKIDDLLEFDFMDPPPPDTILNSMYQLWQLGALDNNGDLTELGKVMVEFPLDPALSKILIVSEKYGCSSEIATIVSMLNVQSIFIRPKDHEKQADLARERFYVPESDHLTLLNVYEEWRLNDNSKEWANENYLNYKSLKKVNDVRKQIVLIMQNNNIELVSCKNNWEDVRKCIVAGYFLNAAKLKGIGEYVNLRTGIPCVLHPSSAIYSLGYTPDYCVYHELIMTSKEYMSCVTAIESSWLVEVVPDFFSFKKIVSDNPLHSTIDKNENKEEEKKEEKEDEDEITEKNTNNID